MPNNYQKNISRPVSLSGAGLHTGIESKLTIKPAKENAGLYFIRVDLHNRPIIHADVNNVIDTNRGTVLQENDANILTVEHVLAALHGMGIDNAEIELTGPEPPILDGSSTPFVNAIREPGTTSQKDLRKVLNVKNQVRYVDNTRGIELNVLPHESFKITFLMDYGLPNFGIQYSSVENVALEIEKEIAPARTFGLLSEITHLKENGLIRGGSLDNAVVFVDKEIDKNEQESLIKLFGNNSNLNFKKGGILNTDGLRFDNEPVRHKVLDLIGDLSLLGKHLCGHVIATKSGHAANIELVKKLKEIDN